MDTSVPNRGGDANPMHVASFTGAYFAMGSALSLSPEVLTQPPDILDR
jgi:hypothetical protein